MPKIATGTRMYWNNIEIGYLTDIDAVKLKNPMEDLTVLTSVARVKGAGLPDFQSIKISGFWVPEDAGQIALLADTRTGTSGVVKITYATQTETTTFDAAPISFDKGEAKIGKYYLFSAELDISGAPSEAAAYLSNLVLTTASLVPTFVSGEFYYIATAASGQTHIHITPTSAGADSITVTAPGLTEVVATGTSCAAIAISDEVLTDITITVTDGDASSHYIVKVGVAGA